MKFCHLLVLPLILTALVAQEKPLRKGPGAVVERTLDSGDKEQKADGEVDLGARKGKVDPNAKRRGAAFCQFRADCRPAKLMPGQSGTVIVTALFKDRAVMTVPAPLAVVSPPQQGNVSLGTPTFREARLGTLARGFQGRPVYDNYAIFEVPVTVAAEAVIGTRLSVSLQMEYELFDGGSAQSLGQFSDQASLVIEVGQSLDPNVRGGFTPPILVAQDEPASASAGGRAEAVSDSGDDAPTVIGGTSTPAEVPVKAPGETSPSPDLNAPGPVVAADDGMPFGLILGGVGLLGLVLLLALKRR